MSRNRDFINSFKQDQLQIKKQTQSYEREQRSYNPQYGFQNQYNQYQQNEDNYYDDEDQYEEDEDDDMPALVDAESPRKSPRKNNMNATKQVEEKNNDKNNERGNQQASEQKEQEIEGDRQKERKGEDVQLHRFDDTYLDEPEMQNYPAIVNYLPQTQDKDSLGMKITDLMTKEEQELKIKEETKLIEKYLNKLFPEELQKEKETSDDKAIEREMETNQKIKGELPQKIVALSEDIWNKDKFKNELEQQYRNQAVYLDKINMLLSDKLILKSNLSQKQKKIIEIQRVLRDLNDYKKSTLNLNNIDEIDQIIQKTSEGKMREIMELKSRVAELEKDGGLYKQKYEVLQEKYRSIMDEANEAKQVIQEQIKQLLNAKRSFMAKKEEEAKKNTEEKSKEAERFSNKLKQKQMQQKQSLNNTMNQSQVVGGMVIQGLDDGVQSQFSSQNITIPSFLQNQIERNGPPANPNSEGKRSSLLFMQSQINSQEWQPGQSKQNQQGYMSFQKNSPPNTPPITTQSPPQFQNTLQQYNEQADIQYNNSNQFSLNGNQQQKHKNSIPNLELDQHENTSSHLQSSTQQMQQQLQQQQQQQQQQLQQQQQATLNKLNQLQTSQEYKPSGQPAGQDAKQLSIQDQRRMKKGQVKFEDDDNQTALKTKQLEEEEEYYNQLCANKIKNMVKAISLSHSQLIEESSYFRK